MKAKASASKDGKKDNHAHVAEMTEAHVAELSVEEEFQLDDESEKELLEIILNKVDKNLVIDKGDDVPLLPGFLSEAGEGMFTCDNHISIDCYVNEVLSHTPAHLHSYTSALQRIQKNKKDQKEKNAPNERLLQEYAYMCEEAYLSGNHEINLNPSVENQTLSSTRRLRL
jgi:hypothetical protein